MIEELAWEVQSSILRALFARFVVSSTEPNGQMSRDRMVNIVVDLTETLSW